MISSVFPLNPTVFLVIHDVFAYDVLVISIENVMKLADKLNWMLALKSYKINQIVIKQLFILQEYFIISLEVKRKPELSKQKILN